MIFFSIFAIYIPAKMLSLPANFA